MGKACGASLLRTIVTRTVRYAPALHADCFLFFLFFEFLNESSETTQMEKLTQRAAPANWPSAQRLRLRQRNFLALAHGSDDNPDGTAQQDLRVGNHPVQVRMNITDIIDPSNILTNLKASNKNQLLKELSRFALKLMPAEVNATERMIYDVLLERERLGTTGLGNGIAIPHGKLPRLKKIICVFARLETPLDFEAIDDQSVDLIFLLLAPEGAGADHLKALALLSRLLRDSGTCEKLRGASSADALYAIILDKSNSAVRTSH